MYRILVVEDETIIRKGIVYGFNYEEMDCIVIGEAADGVEGIQKIKELNPDIVITDINMPLKDAFDMLEETLDHTFSTIILSGYDEFSNARKAIQYGVSEFIVKPINEEELKNAIHRAIQQLKDKERIRLSEKKRDLLLTDSLLPKREVVSDEVVTAMFDYVANNYQRKFVFKDVALTIGYSPASLHKRFKDYAGMTFNEYLNKFRIQTAIQMMQETELKVYEIAEKCGFSQYKYFNTVFNKFTGMTATAFIEETEL